MENPLDVVLHPVRMRILMALAGRELSALQIAEELGDVAQATLYRHLGRLHRAGVLTVTSERQVRGTVEKIYGVNEEYSGASPERLAEVSPEDHQSYFATFVASLLDDFARYARGAEHLDLLADGVGYRKLPLELSDEELRELARGLHVRLAVDVDSGQRVLSCRGQLLEERLEASSEPSRRRFGPQIGAAEQVIP